MRTTTQISGSQRGPLLMLKVDSGDHYPYYRCTVGITIHTITGDSGDHCPNSFKKTD